MNLGKSLAGGLLGAVVGAGAHAGIETAIGGEMSWFPAVTGLLTGLGVRKFDPSVSSSASYLRGAMAALIGLAGILAGVQGSTILQTQGLTGAPAEAASSEETAAPEEETTPQANAETDEAELPPEDPAVAAGPLITQAPRKLDKRNFSVLEFVMIGLGAFLSYELARGSTPEEQAEATDQAPDNPPAA